MVGESKRPPRDRSGERIRGKYELVFRIAVGGMGEVYRAKNLMVGRDVAIKILLPALAVSDDVRARFMREAQMAHFVRHAHVVEIFDIDEDEHGIPFIVQELLEGEDLASYLDRAGGALPVEVTLAVMQPVADALGAAHEKGLVHRDLKPENIFLAAVNDELVPKILDFGISKVSNVDGLGSESEGRLIVGSPTYMSPEQIRTPGDVDQRADVWAVGVILYECLAGRRPFDAISVADLFVQICRDNPPPIDDLVQDLPRALRDLVMGCLNRRADRRPQDGTVLARALRRISSRLSGVLSVPGTVTQRPPPVPVGARVGGPPRMPVGNLDPTAPDLSEYGAFRVPQDLHLDFGELGTVDTQEGIANAVAQVTAARRSSPDVLDPAEPAGRPSTTPQLRPRPLEIDVDPHVFAAASAQRTGHARVSSPHSPPSSSRASRPGRAREAVRPGRPQRLPDVPGMGSILSVVLWLCLSAGALVALAGEEPASVLTRVRVVLPLALLASVLTLGAVSVGVLLRARESPLWSLAFAGVGGAGVSAMVLALGFYHVLPNLPGVRTHRQLFVALAVAALALLFAGVALRALFVTVDALRVRPRHPVLAFGALVFALGLALASGLMGYALKEGRALPAVARAAASLAPSAPAEGASERAPAAGGDVESGVTEPPDAPPADPESSPDQGPSAPL